MMQSTLRFSVRRFYATQTGKSKVGFIGLGNMGAHQAANLLKKGHEVVVFDLNAEAVATLKSKGASVAKSPKEIAQQAKVIVTMLPASQHVRSVYTGAEGILGSVQPGTLLMDSSTIDPATARDVAKLAAEKNATMLDCPVSGGTLGAEAGTLTFMVGGSDEAFQKAKPYLECMGKNIVHCGDTGNGQVAKVCNNLLLGISMIGVSEAMNLGVKNGMDPKKLASIINTSSGRCWSSEIYNPVPGVLENSAATRGYTGGFGAALMLKDLGLAVEAAKASGVPLPLGETSQKVYDTVKEKGQGGKDFSVVYDYFKNNSR